MPRDTTHFDPTDPPGGASDAELLLWQGRCPWCGERTAFAPDEGQGDAWTCMWCNCRFEGPDEDLSGVLSVRVITALWREGDPAKRSSPPVDLPDLSDITLGIALSVTVRPALEAAVELGLELSQTLETQAFRPVVVGCIQMGRLVTGVPVLTIKPVVTGTIEMGV